MKFWNYKDKWSNNGRPRLLCIIYSNMYFIAFIIIAEFDKDKDERGERGGA